MPASIHFRNGKLYYTDSGKGKAVVFLHGFLESKEMWNDITSSLPKTYRSICIDLPGHGQSSCYGYLHSMEFMAESVKAVLRHLKIRSCVMIGHSMGGYATLAFADQHPDMLKGVCLFHSTAKNDSTAKKKDRDRAITLVKKNHKSFIRNAIPLLFRPKNRKLFRNELNELKERALKTPKQGVIASLEGMKTRINREIIMRFAPYPVLYIVGRYDSVLDYKQLISQSQLPEHSTLVLLEESGHMGFIEEPDLAKKAIARFLPTAFRRK